MREQGKDALGAPAVAVLHQFLHVAVQVPDFIVRKWLKYAARVVQVDRFPDRVAGHPEGAGPQCGIAAQAVVNRFRLDAPEQDVKVPAFAFQGTAPFPFGLSGGFVAFATLWQRFQPMIKFVNQLIRRLV